MTHVLAQEALDALPEFLNPVDIALRHAPRPVGCIRRARRELSDALLLSKVRGDVGNQITHERKCAHRLDGYRLLEIELIQARHAHEARHSVDLGGARPALTRLAVPAHRQIVRALGLNLMDGVQHDHSIGYRSSVLLEMPGRAVAAPYLKGDILRDRPRTLVAPRRCTRTTLGDVAHL